MVDAQICEVEAVVALLNLEYWNDVW